MFTQLAVVLSLTASALCNVFVTEPVASTTWNGGSKQTVTWQDNGNTPTLASFGPAIISIYVGNAQQQTSLQTISPNTDVSKASSVDFTIDATIGPNANEYFIRFESLGLKDATNPQYPALAFSAKFTLASMTGNFNATVQSQINGQSTAPIGGSTPAGSATQGAGSPSAAPTVAAITSSLPAKVSSSAAAKSSSGAAKSSNGATTPERTGFAAVAAAVAALAVSLL
jgi:hypothetical protein